MMPSPPRAAEPASASDEPLPPPLTQPSCDLRDFPHMPLDVLRLRDSDLALGDRAAGFVAVLLWCASWHQIPAGSLPNDDAKLAYLAGYGRDIRHWKMMRERGALRGFLLCSDGRLYHPVVAEKALIAMAAKDHQRGRTAAARATLEEKRRLAAGGAESTSNPPPEGLQPASNSPADELQPACSEAADRLESSQPIEIAQFALSVTASKGRESKGKGIETLESSPLSTGEKPRAARARACREDPQFGLFYERYPRKEAPDEALKAWRQVMRAGAKPDDILAGLARYQFSRDPEFIKHPASWLRGGCWKSEAVQSGILFSIAGGQPPPAHDPNDEWGIRGFCNALVASGRAECVEVDGLPKCLCKTSGWHLNDLTRSIALASKLHRSWRGDWTPVVDWLAAGLSGTEIHDRISRRAAWTGYEPPASLRYFDSIMRTALAEKAA